MKSDVEGDRLEPPPGGGTLSPELTMQGLTRRQQEVLTFVEDYLRTHGFPPSVRDIATHLSLASASGVHKHINALVRKRYLSKQQFTSRSLRVLKRSGSQRSVAGEWQDWRVRGVLEDRLIREGAGRYSPTLRVPATWLPGVVPGYVLYVESEAFSEHHIRAGDALLFAVEAHPSPLDLLLVQQDGAYALVRRQPNPGSRSVDVRGVLVGLWRSTQRSGTAEPGR